MITCTSVMHLILSKFFSVRLFTILLLISSLLVIVKFNSHNGGLSVTVWLLYCFNALRAFLIFQNCKEWWTKKLNSILVVISLLLQLQKLISLKAHIYIYINIMRGKKRCNYISRQACFVNRFTLQGFNERIFMWLSFIY